MMDRQRSLNNGPQDKNKAQHKPGIIERQLKKSNNSERVTSNGKDKGKQIEDNQDSEGPLDVSFHPKEIHKQDLNTLPDATFLSNSYTKGTFEALRKKDIIPEHLKKIYEKLQKEIKEERGKIGTDIANVHRALEVSHKLVQNRLRELSDMTPDQRSKEQEDCNDAYQKALKFPITKESCPDFDSLQGQLKAFIDNANKTIQEKEKAVFGQEGDYWMKEVHNSKYLTIEQQKVLRQKKINEDYAKVDQHQEINTDKVEIKEMRNEIYENKQQVDKTLTTIDGRIQNLKQWFDSAPQKRLSHIPEDLRKQHQDNHQQFLDLQKKFQIIQASIEKSTNYNDLTQCMGNLEALRKIVEIEKVKDEVHQATTDENYKKMVDNTLETINNRIQKWVEIRPEEPPHVQTVRQFLHQKFSKMGEMLQKIRDSSDDNVDQRMDQLTELSQKIDKHEGQAMQINESIAPHKKQLAAERMKIMRMAIRKVMDDLKNQKERSAHTDGLAAKDEQLAALRNTKDNEIARLQATHTDGLAAKDEQLAALRNTKDAELSALQTKFAEKDAELSALQTKNTEKDAELSALQTKNTEKDAELSALQTKFAKKDAELTQKEQILTKNREIIENLTNYNKNRKFKKRMNRAAKHWRKRLLEHFASCMRGNSTQTGQGD